jgi:hypothetical protein
MFKLFNRPRIPSVGIGKITELTNMPYLRNIFETFSTSPLAELNSPNRMPSPRPKQTRGKSTNGIRMILRLGMIL